VLTDCRSVLAGLQTGRYSTSLVDSQGRLVSLEGYKRPWSDTCFGKRSLASDLRACAGPYGDGAIDLTVELYSVESGWLAVLLYRARGIGLGSSSQYLMMFNKYRALRFHVTAVSQSCTEECIREHGQATCLLFKISSPETSDTVSQTHSSVMYAPSFV